MSIYGIILDAAGGLFGSSISAGERQQAGMLQQAAHNAALQAYEEQLRQQQERARWSGGLVIDGECREIPEVLLLPSP